MHNSGNSIVTPQREASNPTANPSSRNIAFLSCLYFLKYHARIDDPIIRPVKYEYWNRLSSMSGSSIFTLPKAIIAYSILQLLVHWACHKSSEHKRERLCSS